jgi:hypothetical protein
MNQSSPIKQATPSAPVLQAIRNAASRTGVDFDYLVDQARLESGFREDAKASTSSATGLYQFLNQTWLATVKAHGANHGLGWAAAAIEPRGNGSFTVTDPAMRAAILGLRNQPEAAAAMAGEFAADNRDYLAERLGRAAEPVDLYLAHFLGAAGAGRFLQAWQADPSTPAAALFPEAAAANRSIFYGPGGTQRSLGDIRARFAAKLDAGQDYSAPTANQPVATASNSISFSTRKAELRRIEAMPERLSIDFARNAYQRLASLGGGRA